MTATGIDAFRGLLTQVPGYGQNAPCQQAGYTSALMDELLTDCPYTMRAAQRATCLCHNDDFKIESLIQRDVAAGGCGVWGPAGLLYFALCTVASDIEATLSFEATSGSTTPTATNSLTITSSTGSAATGPIATAAQPTTASTTATSTDTASTGISQSDKIAIGVGLGVGIPSLILAFITLMVMCRGG